MTKYAVLSILFLVTATGFGLATVAQRKQHLASPPAPQAEVVQQAAAPPPPPAASTCAPADQVLADARAYASRDAPGLGEVPRGWRVEHAGRNEHEPDRCTAVSRARLSGGTVYRVFAFYQLHLGAWHLIGREARMYPRY